MTYSVDFRKRVLEIRKAEELTLEETSARFKVGVTSLLRWLKRVEPVKRRNRLPRTIDRSRLLQDVKDYPDAYLYERAERLGVSKGGIGHALRSLGITYKKNTKPPEGGRRKASWVCRTHSKA